MSEEKVKKDEGTQTRKATLGESLITFIGLIVVMFWCIIGLGVGPHMPMFIGVIFAALMSLKIGYTWDQIEASMVKGITHALQSIMILAIIGILVGIWISAGVVPSMIYYGLSILKPSIFLVATVLVCSITSLATGSSWGTAGTMGIALMGIAHGMGVPAPVAAGAILSGAYFGDKMSPLSDTTNLAPAMAGTDVFTHVKAMMKPTVIAYVLSLIFFGVMSSKYGSADADTSSVTELQDALAGVFNISPVLLLPPIIVIVAVALKIPAIPGIVLGIIAGIILAPIFQSGVGMSAIFDAGFGGYVSETGMETLDNLLTAGGLMGMMESISLTIIAMMFGGIAEETGQLEAIITPIIKHVKSLTGLVSLTIFTGFLSNVTMPEQYISILIPGRMFAPVYRERGYHPKLLSATLEAGGTVTSAFVPWNTCGVYMSGILKVPTVQYAPYLVFNILMVVVTIVLTAVGQNVFYAKDDPDTIVS